MGWTSISLRSSRGSAWIPFAVALLVGCGGGAGTTADDGAGVTGGGDAGDGGGRAAPDACADTSCGATVQSARCSEPLCADGEGCTTGTDCVSGVCVGGICHAPTCSDGAKNGTETDVDCGGSCSTKCVNGEHCGVGGDCVSSTCTSGVCVAPPPPPATCSDGAKNGTETDVDCGGSCSTKCVNGEHCGVGGDCVSSTCTSGVCVAPPPPPPTCTDGAMNGTETDVDCGGSCSTKCVNGEHCGVGGDCVSSTCTSGVCVAPPPPPPTCTDGAMNGTETDVDCGGTCSTKCANGEHCGVGGDCASSTCTSGVCVAPPPPPPTCTDGAMNGTETDVDCGGSCSTKCANGEHCGVGGDCVSSTCSSGVCVAPPPPPPTCTDGAMNGTETDIDCGGTCSTKCANGEHCGVGGDCVSSTCTSGVCVAPPPPPPTCSDLAKNGAETDVDCGGGTCPTCADGRSCLVDADCTSSLCASNVCVAAPTCSDGIQNGTETGVDCGGSCAACASATCTPLTIGGVFTVAFPTPPSGASTTTVNLTYVGHYTLSVYSGTFSVGGTDYIAVLSVDTGGTMPNSCSFYADLDVENAACGAPAAGYCGDRVGACQTAFPLGSAAPAFDATGATVTYAAASHHYYHADGTGACYGEPSYPGITDPSDVVIHWHD